MQKLEERQKKISDDQRRAEIALKGKKDQIERKA